ncbi:hypothetical protein G6F56_011646 [Rhizopus delemar]|nr:hypothetical protein G6F56_011646 [Rhizopus delemar]
MKPSGGDDWNQKTGSCLGVLLVERKWNKADEELVNENGLEFGREGIQRWDTIVKGQKLEIAVVWKMGSKLENYSALVVEEPHRTKGDRGTSEVITFQSKVEAVAMQ